jgi:hypothetical protein
MAAYSIYLFGIGSELLKRIELTADTDAQAMDELQVHSRTTAKIELWAGTRLVVRAIRPAKPPRGWRVSRRTSW